MSDADLNYCREIARTESRDWYWCSLLMPKPVASAAMVLAAFDGEMQRIARRSNEAMAGEIRLQWWIEVLEGKREEEGSGHPLARILRQEFVQHPEVLAALARKTEAHIFDLYDDPFVDLPMFEGWCGARFATSFQALALKSGIKEAADTSGHAGMVAGAVHLIRRAGAKDASVERMLQPIMASQPLKGSIMEELIKLAQKHRELCAASMKSHQQASGSIYLPHHLDLYDLERFSKVPESSFTNGIPPLADLARLWLLFRKSFG